LSAFESTMRVEAAMILEDFVRLMSNETVAVYSDSNHRLEAELLLDEVRALGNPVIGVDVEQQVAELLQTDQFWINPPAHLHALIQATNVNIFVVDETYGFRLDHKINWLFETGEHCSIFKIDAGMGTWGLTKDDIALVEQRATVIQRALDGAEKVRITSAGGTDLTLSLKGRRCLPIMPVPERGAPYALSVPLWGEFNWAPIEDSAHGQIVIDGLTEAGKRMEVVSEPVIISIENGRAVKAEGGSEARDFERVFAIDEGANVVGELGVGGNHRALLGKETEKALLGTIHIGFGSNHAYPGGLNQSEVHVDGVSRDVTVEVNGQILIHNGQVVSDS
jgi:hypothetical protein